MNFSVDYYMNLISGSSMFVKVIAVLLLCLFMIANMCIFSKANESGWKALIPFYNSYTFYKIVMGTGWIFVFQYIPCVGWLLRIYSNYKLARCFGYGPLFTLGIILFYPIFILIVAFGKNTYHYV